MKNTLAHLTITLMLVGCSANPAQNVPPAQINSPGTAATTAETPTARETGTPADAKRFAITPETSKVEWVGSKITRSHSGGFKKFQGEIAVVGGDAEKSAVNVEIDAESLFSDDEKLTGHLKSDEFFDVAKFPKATFNSTKVAKAGEAYEMTGDFTLHGVTKSITFPANVTLEPEAVKAKAEFAIKRVDFGIKYPGKADDLIRDEVVIKLDLNAPAAK